MADALFWVILVLSPLLTAFSQQISIVVVPLMALWWCFIIFGGRK